MKEINGVKYVQVPEKGVFNSCDECVADNDHILCEALDKNSCINNGMIYVEKKETFLDTIVGEFNDEEVKMEKKTTNVFDIIKDSTAKILDIDLKTEVYTFFDINSFNSMIETAIENIEDYKTKDYISDIMDTVSNNYKSNYIKKMVNDDINELINLTERDKINQYDGLEIVKKEAKSLLKRELLRIVSDNNLEELRKYYMKSFYEKIENQFPDAIYEMVVFAIDNLSDDRVIEMVSSIISSDVEKYIEENFS